MLYLCPTSNGWDVQRIRSLLPQLEDTIRQLRPSSKPTPDAFVWLPEKPGTYSSKSGYNLLKNNGLAPSPNAFSWSPLVWNLKTSPKIKSFLWKVASGILPTGVSLATRGIQAETACKRCGEQESTTHLLLHCHFALDVWRLAPISPSCADLAISEAKVLLKALKQRQNLPPVGTSVPLYPWILWNIWIARNQMVFSDRVFTAEETLVKAILDAKVWSQAQLVAAPCPTVPLPLPLHRSAPRRPIFDLILETDAAWKAVSLKCGLGWVGRDSSGSLCFKDSTSECFVASALQAEALAILAGLNYAFSRGFSSVLVKSDSKTLIDLLLSGMVTNELVGLLHDIRHLQFEFSAVSFSFIPRTTNVLADVLAKCALLACPDSNPCLGASLV